MPEPSEKPSSDAALEAFEAKQKEELRAFEERQREQLAEFERREREELVEFEQRQGRAFKIRIDREEFDVREARLTGLQLRDLPKPPIGADRDLFEVVPGGSDLKISDTQEVKMRDGLRFFTAPAQINPGVR